MKTAIAVLLLFAVLILAAVLCPIHGEASYFTGKTKVIAGTLAYEYRCPLGHVFWSGK